MATLKERTALAENLRRLRLVNNMTQQDIADIADVSKTAVDKWESGAYTPNVFAAAAIADTFGITVEQLLTEAEPETETN